MSFEYFIGRRYLRSRQKHTFISMITVLSAIGVSLGVMVMIIVIAVMSGAESELRTRMLGVTAHVLVSRHGGTFTGYENLEKRIRAVPGVRALSPYIYAQAMLRSPANITGAVLRGIDPESAGKVIRTLPEASLKELGQKNADSPVPGIILGKELAALLQTREGELISLTLPGSGAMNLVPAMRRFRVVGMYQSGLYEFDKSLAYIHLEDARKILGSPDALSGIEVRVSDIYNAGEIAKTIVSVLGFPYWAQDWMQMNRNIFSALRLQKVVMFIILTLIVIVAAFNIASSLIMMVMEKTRDIAILKAMGATDAGIRRIFVFKGMLIGAGGTFFGVTGGALVCFLLKKYKFIKLSTKVYLFPHLPVSLQTGDVLLIVAGTLLICFLATMYPAQKAARMNPADTLRYG
ncbi:MAG: lipoprotein-releasing ABC transporter permease subunit [Desulfococcaceae bacterium]|nr:lipoprotein-releasing ABC transporter permease subunit [Desulfococcaceae bacterium]